MTLPAYRSTQSWREGREVLVTFRATVKRNYEAPSPEWAFGLLGAGNVGNDGSLEVVLSYLRITLSRQSWTRCARDQRIANPIWRAGQPLALV